jgi:hypothetical protein
MVNYCEIKILIEEGLTVKVAPHVRGLYVGTFGECANRLAWKSLFYRRDI